MIPCPVEGCGGRLEANPKLYVTIKGPTVAGAKFSVMGLQTDDVELTCDSAEHTLSVVTADSERVNELYGKLTEWLNRLDDLIVHALRFPDL